MLGQIICSSVKVFEWPAFGKSCPLVRLCVVFALQVYIFVVLVISCFGIEGRILMKIS